MKVKSPAAGAAASASPPSSNGRGTPPLTAHSTPALPHIMQFNSFRRDGPAAGSFPSDIVASFISHQGCGSKRQIAPRGRFIPGRRAEFSGIRGNPRRRRARYKPLSRLRERVAATRPGEGQRRHSAFPHPSHPYGMGLPFPLPQAGEGVLTFATAPLSSRSTHMAMPMPPPMQRVARPRLALRFCIS